MSAEKQEKDPGGGPGWGVILTAASGALPFALAAAWALTAEPMLRVMLAEAALAYGAILIGFLGGVRWGAEVARAPHHPSLPRLAAAAAPTLVAFGVLYLARADLMSGALAVIVAGLAQLAWDVRSARAGLLPAWTAPVRIALTALASLALLAIVALSAQP